MFYKESYGSLEKAIKKTDAVAVLGVFLKEGKRNKKFDRWMEKFDSKELHTCGVLHLRCR